MRILPDGTKVVWEPLAGSQTLALTCPANIVVFHGTRGPGKGLPVGEPVYTPIGQVPIGSLEEGDLVCCPDGSTSPVVGVYPQGQRQTYEIEFFDGSIARCDDQHIWNLHVGGRFPAGTYKNFTMSEVLRMFKTTDYRLNIPTLNKVEMSSCANLPIEPYMMGLFLGDGCSAQRGSYCTADSELADHALQYGFRETLCDQRSGLRNFSANNDFTEALNTLSLQDVKSQTKYVPSIYLHQSYESRLAILQGLMDTDGTIDKNGYISFCSRSLQLAKDVQYLARSLGARATLTDKFPTIGETVYDKAYQIYIQTGNKFVPFRLKRKVDRIKPYMHKHLTNKIVAIRELGMQETICIKIAHPEGLFITRDFVVTHNTDAQLMRFRRNVGQGYGRYWRGIIFDREYKNLDDLVSKSMRWFPEFKDGARFMSSKADYRWVWPTGEELLFRAIKKDTDYWGYHGQEFPFIGWNELTKYPSDALFESMMSCNRSSFLPSEHPQFRGEETEPYFLREIPLEVFVTTNPYGAGHNWVKKRFISVGKPGQIVKKVVNVFNPRTQQREDVVKTQTHLFGSYRENKYLSPEYVAELESIADPNKRRAWLYGDWDIIAGGMFDDVWDKDKHIIQPFDIPANWRIDRSYDHGESRPFSVGWWAESDGSDVKLSNGKWMSTVKGDLFRIDEWYGWTGKPNQGLRMLSTDIAAGIIEREIKMGIHNRVQPGPADNSIWDVENGNSIAADMAKTVKIDGKRYKGVQWLRSDKAKGSRTAGWKQIRQYMKDALPQFRETGIEDANGKPILVPIPREKPGMFIFNTCTMFIDLFPVAPRDETNPDDIDTESEDHICDEVRYKALSTEVGVRGGRTKGLGG